MWKNTIKWYKKKKLKIITSTSNDKFESPGVFHYVSNGENVPSLEIGEVVLVDNQYHQKSEVLYIFTPNKFYAYLLNVEPSNLVFLKTYNLEFDEVIIISTDENGSPLEIENKVKLKLFINKYKWRDLRA